jgi:hypothetical protein
LYASKTKSETKTKNQKSFIIIQKQNEIIEWISFKFIYISKIIVSVCVYIFKKAAKEAVRSVWKRRSQLGLVGNHVIFKTKEKNKTNEREREKEKERKREKKKGEGMGRKANKFFFTLFVYVTKSIPVFILIDRYSERILVLSRFRNRFRNRFFFRISSKSVSHHFIITYSLFSQTTKCELF